MIKMSALLSYFVPCSFATKQGDLVKTCARRMLRGFRYHARLLIRPAASLPSVPRTESSVARRPEVKRRPVLAKATAGKCYNLTSNAGTPIAGVQSCWRYPVLGDVSVRIRFRLTFSCC